MGVDFAAKELLSFCVDFLEGFFAENCRVKFVYKNAW